MHGSLTDTACPSVLVLIFMYLQKHRVFDLCTCHCRAAAAFVDRPWMGRVRMQIMGFTWMFVLFLCCAVAYNNLTEPCASVTDKLLGSGIAVPS